MQLKMPANPEWLRASTQGATAVDRERGIIHGVILAEEGPFKSDGRGEFDRQAIRSVVKLANERKGGLKSRLGHPTLSDDGLGKFLGRVKNAKSSTVLREQGKDADGKPLLKEMLVARGDLHLDKTALEEPIGGGKPLGVYVMDLAESDPDAFGTSLVLKSDQEFRLDKKGRPLTDDDGNELPPLWRPKELHASDVVDTGDATNSFLSVDHLPDAIVRQGCELLDAQFAGQERDVVQSRLTAFVDRYLAYRFGSDSEALEAETASEPIEAGDVEPAQSGGEPVASDDALLLEIAIACEGE